MPSPCQNQKPIIHYLNDFLDYCEIEKGLSKKTQENYKRFLLKFFLWLKKNNLSELIPSQLSFNHIWNYKIFLSRFKNSKSKQVLKKSTQNYYLIALRSLLDFFVDKKIDCISPTQIKLSKNKNEKIIHYLKLEQIKKLLSSPNVTTKIGLRDKAILETLFSTGMRVAELRNLNLDQFKIKKKTNDLEISIIGKGNKIRTVFFSSRAVYWLKKYIDNRTDTESALFINYKPGIQKKCNSRRLSTQSIETIVKKYSKIAGLPTMTTPHTLRHSYATDLLNQGVDLRLVQEFLGHRNIATTQIYTHVTNKRLREIHKKFHGGKDLDN
jgi:site-specific recombinase XerD